MIHAIPTVYAGVQFRSRLEAKWACFFDMQSWKWEYEPFDLDGYIPDFTVKAGAAPTLIAEIKPLRWDESDTDGDTICDARAKLRGSGWTGEALLLGTSVTNNRLGMLLDRHMGWDDATPFQCRDCGRNSFCSLSGSFQCRVSGCGDGNNHIDWHAWDVVQDFRAASNRVQWRAA